MKITHLCIATAALISAASTFCSFTLAQPNSNMQVDVSRCVIMTNVEQRHECFDEITSHLRSDDAAIQVPVSSPVRTAEVSLPVADITNETAVSEFGLESSKAEIASNDDGDAELHDTIAELEEREPGRWLVTLVSGQVWYQETTGRVRLKKGMKVRLYPSSFGKSYRLAADEINAVIQVRRIK